MKIEVTVKLNDLEYVRYDYWLNGVTLYLDKMFTLRKKTKRHKLRIDFNNSYSRIDQRDFGIKEEPDVDIGIQQEALRIARDMIKVERWKR